MLGVAIRIAHDIIIIIIARINSKKMKNELQLIEYNESSDEKVGYIYVMREDGWKDINRYKIGYTTNMRVFFIQLYFFFLFHHY
jgi:hypothetical protein